MSPEIKVLVLLGDPRKEDAVKPGNIFDDDDIDTVEQLKVALAELEGFHFSFLDDHDRFIDHLRESADQIDLVLNFCDEGFNNDPRRELNVPALVEMRGLPYTGASPQCMVYCYDKYFIKLVARSLGVPVARDLFLDPVGGVPRLDLTDPRSLEEFAQDLPVPYPVIVKPNFADGGFGITQKSVASTPEELVRAIIHIQVDFKYDEAILVEQYLQGADLTAGILGNPPINSRFLPVIQEDYSQLPPELPKICGYEAKWYPDSPYWTQLRSVPAEISDEARVIIERSCVKLFQRLDCHDYCRFDWRCDLEGNPFLLEVNPNPGWCWDGHMAKMSNIAGISYPEMLRAITESALARNTR